MNADELRRRLQPTTDELLQFRALLGVYMHPISREIFSIKENPASEPNSDREVIIANKKDNQKEINNYCSRVDVQAFVDSLRQEGYNFISPKYPKAQEFFRDGKPVTPRMLIQDEIKAASKSEQIKDGLAELYDKFFE
jgi:hypothetical protein